MPRQTSVAYGLAIQAKRVSQLQQFQANTRVESEGTDKLVIIEHKDAHGTLTEQWVYRVERDGTVQHEYHGRRDWRDPQALSALPCVHEVIHHQEPAPKRAGGDSVQAHREGAEAR